MAGPTLPDTNFAQAGLPESEPGIHLLDATI
jgi:hypothetical protein